MNPRDIYFQTIQELVKTGEDLIILHADLAAPSLDSFRKNFPNRFISVGVSEQNLISTAAGLASAGKKVIAWGLNPFLVTRTVDQVWNTVSLMNVPITLAGLHAGLSSAVTGPTHVVINDLAIMRMCPHIKIINPSDINIAELVAYETVKREQPIYVRFDKDITYELYDKSNVDFNKGIGCINKGKNFAIITTGYHTKKIKDLLIDFNNVGINPTILDIYSLPFNENLLLEYLNNMKKIVVVEEHIVQGGLGSAILEFLSKYQINIPTKCIGIDVKNGYPEVFGRRDYFQKLFNLDSKSLKEDINKFFKER